MGIRNSIKAVAVCTLAAAMLSGCGSVSNSSSSVLQKDTECMYQVATLQSLMQGYYSTVTTAKDLKTHGDIGLGTFENCNGEMIMLNGKIYQALSTGELKEVDDSTGIPFASVTEFEMDLSQKLENISDIDSLKNTLTKKISGHENTMCAVKISGSFNNVKFRSENPIPENKNISLSEWLKDNQVEWTKSNISGTIVAVYFPNYLDGINTPGWHLHFVSDDLTCGGHLLEVNLKSGKAEYDITNEYKIVLPDTQKFQNLDLTLDQKADIQKVEK